MYKKRKYINVSKMSIFRLKKEVNIIVYEKNNNIHTFKNF